jgi:hypothetical protein
MQSPGSMLQEIRRAYRARGGVGCSEDEKEDRWIEAPTSKTYGT